MQSHLKSRAVSLVLAFLAAVALLGVAQGVEAKQPAAKSPVAVSGKQSKPAIAPGSKDKVSPQTAALGTTKFRQTDLNGKPVGFSPQVGNNSNVDFTAVYNYCQGDLVYTPVHNYSSATQYFEVVLYNGGSSRTYYTSVAAGGTAYPYWYGVQGTYYAYLYVWDGSSYAYDEYLTSANNCNVSVTITISTGYTGYVLLTITNNGTSYVRPYTSLKNTLDYCLNTKKVRQKVRLFSWQGRQDSNLRHPVLETGALPTELLPFTRTNLVYQTDAFLRSPMTQTSFFCYNSNI